MGPNSCWATSVGGPAGASDPTNTPLEAALLSVCSMCSVGPSAERGRVAGLLMGLLVCHAGLPASRTDCSIDLWGSIPSSQQQVKQLDAAAGSVCVRHQPGGSSHTGA